jgi:transcriptional regulator of acetoin/glycerol metabolism
MSLLQESASEAWQLYRGRGQISNKLLRSHVYRAWERSHIQKASPLHMKAEQLSAVATERLLREKHDLIDAARPYMQALSAAAGHEKHAAMLGDERAIVLDVVADEATLHGPEGFPGPGSMLQEALSGANGIGTPLIENAYAELVGAEHFIQGFHVYTCQGIPIVGPGQQVVGVLSTSVRRPEASQRLREIMIVAAQGIGAELIVRQWESMLQRMVQHAQLSPETLEKLRQDLMQLYNAGRMHVELAALHLSRTSNHQRPEGGLRLLDAAARAIEKFREQSSLCLRLTSQGTGLCDWFQVRSVLEPIAELLATETRIRRVTVLMSGPQDTWIQSDRRRLEKYVLRLFLQGLSAAEGSVLKVDVFRHGAALSLEIRFTSRPDSKVHASHTALFISAEGVMTFESGSQTL